MRAFGLLLAAGSSTRFGRDKLAIRIGDRPVWRWSFDALASHPSIEGVGIVGPDRGAPAAFSIPGGSTRTESAELGLRQVPDWAEIVLIHDAARPFATRELIDRVLKAAEEKGASYPAIPVVDTMRSDSGDVVDRSKLFACQTPQAARREFLIEAYDARTGVTTDDIELLSQAGHEAARVDGDAANFKITSPEDLMRALSQHGSVEQRTGIGYDVHAFSLSEGRPLVLGGVELPDSKGLEGHSDADVLLHAITDAILGAASLGDIGDHFPPSDPQWKDCASSRFLAHAQEAAAENGWNIMNIDATVIAEAPKLGPHKVSIRRRIAEILGIGSDDVSVKATTHEGLGSIGRGEGIACMAVASLVRSK